MIPKDFITEWRTEAPWTAEEQVEQDLVISRAIVEMFHVEDVARRLAWRGGTALHKLYLRPTARYSEDIDLVQVAPEPIGETLDLLRSVLDSWLGEPRRVFKEGRVNLVYRFDSEGLPPAPLRLKIEINTREHFAEHGHERRPFSVFSKWFRGNANVTTFTIDELLGTKLRALYQRKKGRDLFDLWDAVARGAANAESVIECFHRYMQEGGHAVSRAQFEENLECKRNDARFVHDIEPLLRPGITWDVDIAMDVVLAELVARLPGAPWRST